MDHWRTLLSKTLSLGFVGIMILAAADVRTDVSLGGTLDLLRANTRYFAGDRVTIQVGRFDAATGYGFAWNPTDFFSPSDGASSSSGLPIGGAITASFAASSTPASLGDIQAGAKAVFFVPGVEGTFTGLYDYDATPGDDAYASGLGVSAKLDLADCRVLLER